MGWKKGPQVGMIPWTVGTAYSRLIPRDYNQADLTILRGSLFLNLDRCKNILEPGGPNH